MIPRLADGAPRPVRSPRAPSASRKPHQDLRHHLGGEPRQLCDAGQGGAPGVPGGWNVTRDLVGGHPVGRRVTRGAFHGLPPVPWTWRTLSAPTGSRAGPIDAALAPRGADARTVRRAKIFRWMIFVRL